MYNKLKEEFINIIENEVHGEYKQRAYFHSIQVSQLCRLYAKERGVDAELAAIAGLFHDVSFYTTRNSKLHGVRSADILSKILLKYHTQEKKREMLLNAIRVHSDKHLYHDILSEILKDADVNAKYLEEPDAEYSRAEKERIRY